jgi:hypothetical protein
MRLYILGIFAAILWIASWHWLRMLPEAITGNVSD